MKNPICVRCGKEIDSIVCNVLIDSIEKPLQAFMTEQKNEKWKFVHSGKCPISDLEKFNSFLIWGL